MHPISNASLCFKYLLNYIFKFQEVQKGEPFPLPVPSQVSVDRLNLSCRCCQPLYLRKTFCPEMSFHKNYESV